MLLSKCRELARLVPGWYLFALAVRAGKVSGSCFCEESRWLGLIPSAVWIIGVVLVLGFFAFGWDWVWGVLRLCVMETFWSMGA